MEVLGGSHLAGELIWRDGDVWHRAWQGSGKAGLSSTADLTTPPPMAVSGQLILQRAQGSKSKRPHEQEEGHDLL